MKGKIFLICIMTLIIIVSLMFSNSVSFALYKPAKIMIARAGEMDYRFSEAQEEEMKDDEWYAVPEDDGNDVIILEPDEDTFRDAPYKFEPDEEHSPEPHEYEGKEPKEPPEEPEDESSPDTESRR